MSRTLTPTHRTALPTHFLVPFLGLLILLMLGVYELLLPADRALWLLVGGATIAGVYLRPSAAAALGWVLVLLLGAYLAVNSAVSPVSGASWLTLLLVPWLPPFASNVADFVKQNQRRLERQRELIEAEASLHPLTNLPSASLATQFIPRLNANVQRVGHTGLLVEAHITNLPVLQSLHSPDELGQMLIEMHDTMRQALRSSDWLFHLTDDTMLILADLGKQGTVPLAVAASPEGADGADGADGTVPAVLPTTTGEQVLLAKIAAALAPLRQIELELRSLLLGRDIPPAEVLLNDLHAQPVARVAHPAPAVPLSAPVVSAPVVSAPVDSTPTE